MATVSTQYIPQVSSNHRFFMTDGSNQIVDSDGNLIQFFHFQSAGGSFSTYVGDETFIKGVALNYACIDLFDQFVKERAYRNSLKQTPLVCEHDFKEMGFIHSKKVCVKCNIERK